jgi:general secretion pathway protein A
LIDEAQKLNKLSLEILRVLLNYETNEFKMLQLVLLGQIELTRRLRQMRNLNDRISLKYLLRPLDERQTKELILFRLKAAGLNSQLHLFTEEAMQEIYRASAGYPRRIALICHNALKNLVMENRSMVDAQTIQRVIIQQQIEDHLPLEVAV